MEYIQEIPFFIPLQFWFTKEPKCGLPYKKKNVNSDDN